MAASAKKISRVSSPASVSKRGAKKHVSGAKYSDSVLSDYLKLLSHLPLFTVEEEQDYAKKLRESEVESWRRALFFPDVVSYLLSCEDLENFAPLAALTTLQHRYQRAGVAADGAPRRAAKIWREIDLIAEALRDFDSDRKMIDRVVERLRSVSPERSKKPQKNTVSRLRQGLKPDRPSRVHVRDVLNVYAEAIDLRNRFVRANLRLVVSVARNFRRYKLPLVDLIQEGNLGLIKAVHRFDHRKGFRFSTYAHWWIRQSIERAIVNKGSQVRVPVHIYDTRRQVNRSIRELNHELGREPTDQEIADFTELPLEKIVHARQVITHEPVSLDDVLSDEDDRNMADVLADDSRPAPDDAVIERDQNKRVRELLGLLNPVEMDVICRRFGLLGDNDETLEQIGKSYQLSRERVRQIQVQGLKKMKRFCERRDITG